MFKNEVDVNRGCLDVTSQISTQELQNDVLNSDGQYIPVISEERSKSLEHEQEVHVPTAEQLNWGREKGTKVRDRESRPGNRQIVDRPTCSVAYTPASAMNLAFSCS